MTCWHAKLHLYLEAQLDVASCLTAPDAPVLFCDFSQQNLDVIFGDVELFKIVNDGLVQSLFASSERPAKASMLM